MYVPIIDIKRLVLGLCAFFIYNIRLDAKSEIRCLPIHSI